MKVILSGCLLAASSAMLAGCNTAEPAPAVAAQTVQARVVQSRQEQAPAIVRSTGTLHARESAIVSAQVVGRIEQVLVREGDNVRAGQTLAVLDDATLRASSHQAEAGLAAAQSQQAAAQTDANLAASTLERYKQLQAQKSVSPQELDEVTRRAEASAERVEALRAQVEAAKAQDSGARAMLGYTRLRAPFAGVVTARLADPGTLASPGVPLLQVDSAGPLQLQVTVDRVGHRIGSPRDESPCFNRRCANSESHGHSGGNCSSRRSRKPQLYGQDRYCFRQRNCAQECTVRQGLLPARASQFLYRAPP